MGYLQLYAKKVMLNFHQSISMLTLRLVGKLTRRKYFKSQFICGISYPNQNTDKVKKKRNYFNVLQGKNSVS